MSNQELSKNLKKLRDKKGFSQDRLAKLADVANNTVIKIEQGENKNPTLETLKKLATALGVSLDDLIK
ncbi:MAG: helix-turn-helix transcriptional regulator [Candidatus Shapirobacteria bacterium]|nr:helix-turn-helix transcriptional regulator [Candidatus Shapirobacteria bacterium]